MKAKLFLFLLIFTLLAHANPSIYSFNSSKEAERFQTLIKETRCVVCQNQSIADSHAPLANDLREIIYRMILDTKSDDEIKNFLADRYGEFILLKPRFNKLTLLLWIFPFLALMLILFFFLNVFLKQKIIFKSD